MNLLDIALIGQAKLKATVTKMQNYRGVQYAKNFTDWAAVFVYQQSQIESLQRNVQALCTAHSDEGHGHSFDTNLEWPAGSDPDPSGLPIPKLTHEVEFEAFIMWTRELLEKTPRIAGRMAEQYDHEAILTGFDTKAAELGRRLFRYREDDRKAARGSAVKRDALPDSEDHLSGGTALGRRPSTLDYDPEDEGVDDDDGDEFLDMPLQLGRRYLTRCGATILMGAKDGSNPLTPGRYQRWRGSNGAFYDERGRCRNYETGVGLSGSNSEHDCVAKAPLLDLKDRHLYKAYNGQTFQVFFDSNAKGCMFRNNTGQHWWDNEGKRSQSPTEWQPWSSFDLVAEVLGG